MADWTPPPFGTPVWIGIPAKDVQRASEFYGAVFNLRFKDNQPVPDTRLFDLNPGLNITGGIQQVPDSTGIFCGGRGGPCIYWLVEDCDAIGETIAKAGGKMLSDKEKEGGHGLYRFFEDTEGTVGAVYMTAPNPSK